MWSIFQSIIILSLALFLISFGADKVIDGLEDLAEYFKLSKIGMAFLVLGVDLEEIIASIQAARNGLALVALGNVVGNTLLSLTLAFAIPTIFFPIHFKKVPKWYYSILFVSSLLGAIGIWFSEFLVPIGIILILLFVAYSIKNIIDIKKEKLKTDNLVLLERDLGDHIKKEESVRDRDDLEKNKECNVEGNEEGKDEGEEEGNEEGEEENVLKIIFWFILGLVFLVVGSDLLIPAIKSILSQTIISETFFGVIVIAAATNVEEYTLLFKSIKQKKSEIGIGAMIGKMLWNLCLTYGISALIIGGQFSLSYSLLYNSILLSVIVVPLFIIFINWKKSFNLKIGLFFFVEFLVYLKISFTFI